MKLTDVILGEELMSVYIDWVNKINFQDITAGFEYCIARGRFYEIGTKGGRIHKVPRLMAKNIVFLLFIFSWGLAKSSKSTTKLADLL